MENSKYPDTFAALDGSALAARKTELADVGGNTLSFQTKFDQGSSPLVKHGSVPATDGAHADFDALWSGMIAALSFVTYLDSDMHIKDALTASFDATSKRTIITDER